MTQSVLITGANRGIGLQFCKHYLAAGWQVIACCRQPAQATALTELAQQYAELSVEPLDIADHKQIEALAKRLGSNKIDVLVNNAGIYGPKGASFEQVTTDDWLDVLHIDTIAPLLVTRALKPSLKAASKVAFISSKMGSISDNQSGGSYMYRSAKAALNAAVKSLAHDWYDDELAIVTLHPGWVQTDMGGPNAMITTEQSVAGMTKVIEQLKLGDSGQFINYDGAPIPW
ncbi:SDR family oxidoreductase [Neiella marina]|uniref:SDR family oxidoreductase n=1 Tax=Neiella holothuriorum TaxID=2870530 RepID=A0ABS7EHM7_9GAMM|nr:SDR family oxidoreductase [Neiella holothuriorum]MBW8191847.1 SDR family oxidoreductase [Neiella holothuriorum]